MSVHCANTPLCLLYSCAFWKSSARDLQHHWNNDLVGEQFPQDNSHSRACAICRGEQNSGIQVVSCSCIAVPQYWLKAIALSVATSQLQECRGEEERLLRAAKNKILGEAAGLAKS